jgi:prepilin-type N-terminal cleavage/methylation domain-containing protein
MKGFTLIELLLVIAIVGVLAAVGIQSFSGSQAKTRDSRRKADLKAIQQALEEYYNDHGRYPNSSGNGGFPLSTAGGFWIDDGLSTPRYDLDSTYIKSMPVDPKNTGSPMTSGVYGYMYRNWGPLVCGTYILATRLENSNDPQAGNQISSGAPCNQTYGPFSGVYLLTSP